MPFDERAIVLCAAFAALMSGQVGAHLQQGKLARVVVSSDGQSGWLADSDIESLVRVAEEEERMEEQRMASFDGSVFEAAGGDDPTALAATLTQALVGIYVISMPTTKGDLAFDSFVSAFNRTAGVGPAFINRHDGIVDDGSLSLQPWVQQLIPGIVEEDERVPQGTLGADLAHLTLWKKIAQSSACLDPNGRQRFALVFEDDEQIKPTFASSLAALLEALNALRNPLDHVLLNALRPRGDNVSVDLPGGISLLRVAKQENVDRFVRMPNVWSGAYLMRCGAAEAIIRDLVTSIDTTLADNVRKRHGMDYTAKTWGGKTPVDRQLSRVLRSRQSELTGGVLSPTNAISWHACEHFAHKDYECKGKGSARGA